MTHRDVSLGLYSNTCSGFLFLQCISEDASQASSVTETPTNPNASLPLQLSAPGMGAQPDLQRKLTTYASHDRVLVYLAAWPLAPTARAGLTGSEAVSGAALDVEASRQLRYDLGKQRGGLALQRTGDSAELDNINAPDSSFDLGNERLRLLKTCGQLRLSNASVGSGFHQHIKHMPIRIGEQGLRHGPLAR